VHDAAEDTAIVHPSGTRSALRQQRLNDCPLPIVEPELACRDPSPAVSVTESPQTRILISKQVSLMYFLAA
jgi:hypothetical protein